MAVYKEAGVDILSTDNLIKEIIPLVLQKQIDLAKWERLVVLQEYSI